MESSNELLSLIFVCLLLLSMTESSECEDLQAIGTECGAANNQRSDEHGSPDTCMGGSNRAKGAKHVNPPLSLSFDPHPLPPPMSRKNITLHKLVFLINPNNTGPQNDAKQIVTFNGTTKVSMTGNHKNHNADESAPERAAIEPILSKKEPRWWDACNRKAVFNNTLVNIIIGPQIFQPAHVTKEDLQERGKYISSVYSRRNMTLSAANQSVASVSSVLASIDSRQRDESTSYQHADEGAKYSLGRYRHKRSIKGGLRSTITTLVQHSEDSPNAMNEIVPDKDSLYLKKPDSRSSIKKTSFSMGPRKKYWPSMGNSKLWPNKHRYYQSDNTLTGGAGIGSYGNIPQVNVNNTSEMTHSTYRGSNVIDTKTNKERASALFDTILRLDVRVSWQIHVAISSVKEVKKLVSSIRQANQAANDTTASEVSDGSTMQAPLDDARLAEIRSQRDWLPDFDQLADRAHLRPPYMYRLYEPVARSLLINMTHYLEFFNVAFEQMLYEQTLVTDRWLRYGQLYKDMERVGLKLQCDSENLIGLIGDINNNRRELKRLYDQLKTYQGEHQHMKDISGLKHNEILYNEHLMVDLVTKSRGLGNESDVQSLMNQNFSGTGFDSPLRQAIIALRQQHSGDLQSAKGLGLDGSVARALSNDGLKHIWREIMPLEQRRLRNEQERAHRDQLILAEFSKLITFFESFLLKNYT